MKKSTISQFILMFLTGLACSFTSDAQFFKNVLNSVKQTVQGKSNDKASQVTSQTFDKVTGLPQSKTKTGGTTTGSNSPGSSTAGNAAPMGDSASTNRVLGAFAKAAAANPNDTSASDLTMKALGILTGHEGVSAADSAAAIKSFMTAGSGSGFFYQFQTTSNTKKGMTKDTSNIYMSSTGNGRSEMRISMPGATSGKIINIGHAAQRQYTVLLDPDNKTYSLNVIDTAFINSGAGETYQVTKIGSETVQGYSCIHSKLTSTIGSGAFKSVTTIDLWTSTAVPGYSLFVKMGSIQNVQPKMMVALDKAGAGGFLVKMTAGDKDYSMTMLLARAEAKTFPGSLFMIPPGYKESNETMMSRMASGVKR